MNIKISHHIFGSSEGYRTLFQSASIIDTECEELESFSFGQTNDPDYINSLSNDPAYLVRKLKTGRWAITRVFKGFDDEYGRRTLLFHSVIVEQNVWLKTLDCDTQPLLFHPKLWKHKEQETVSIKLDSSPIPKET